MYGEQLLCPAGKKMMPVVFTTADKKRNKPETVAGAVIYKHTRMQFR
jgi:hypothetical protein